jgi:hypothetical protein
MRIQVKEYIEFVKKFTESTNIMTKNFFIVVSYAPSVIDTSKKGSILGSLFGKKGSVKTVENTQFEETRSQLEERMAVVEQ